MRPEMSLERVENGCSGRSRQRETGQGAYTLYFRKLIHVSRRYIQSYICLLYCIEEIKRSQCAVIQVC